MALACRSLTMMASLFDDLQVENNSDTSWMQNSSSPQIEPAPLHILSQATALQRAARILTAAPLNQFLFYLATISYRKVRNVIDYFHLQTKSLCINC